MKCGSAIFPVECSTNTFLGLRTFKNKSWIGGAESARLDICNSYVLVK